MNTTDEFLIAILRTTCKDTVHDVVPPLALRGMHHGLSCSTPLRVPEKHFVNGHRIIAPFPAGLREAVFGLGCFWGGERLFWETPGVYSMAVGYAGGYTPNATYEEVCTGSTGHAEVVKGIYVLDEEQKTAAEDSKRKYQARLTAAGKGEITTEILDARRSITPRINTSSTSRRIRTGTPG